MKWFISSSAFLGLLASSPAVLNGKGNVESYYGVRLDIVMSCLPKLKLPYKRSASMEEGSVIQTAEFYRENNVIVTAAFDDDGRLLALKTDSKNAVDPRGVKIGDPLSRARSAWPNGRFYTGYAEGKWYATFLTGTNVVLRFGTKPKNAANEDVRLKEIEILPYEVWL